VNWIRISGITASWLASGGARKEVLSTASKS